ncbi:MAG: hypothetical protein ETSY1_32290, partial [Candidatus Entotheonella factor]
MQFDYAYFGNTAVDHRADRTALSFAPDLKRQPTFFTGKLRHSLAFREAISALHDVVISDLRFQPRDKSEYKAWAAQRELEEWGVLQAEIGGQKQAVVARMLELQQQIQTLDQRQYERRAPFYRARQKYFNYLYERDRDAWFVLDPVITVHPDELFFECFSQDESSYGRLGVDYEVFEDVGDYACGTTNIDYSQALYDEFQKIRSYRTTEFTVDPSGFEVATEGEERYRELKIDLPDSWVRGFLQVNSAMSLDATRVDLHPLDIHNFCFVLRRHKAKTSPRSMRYHLDPGKPVRVVFEPWNIEVACPRSIYEGPEATEIRVWGRRRLLILERLIPIAKQFSVYLLGTGMPSFYVADLGNMWFTLGLSGWTANDWSTAGNFDLMAPRAEVDSFTRERIFHALHESWYEHPDALAARLQLDPAVVLGALGLYTQAGRAIFDLNKQVYRLRELSRDPLPMDTLRFANEREQSAYRFLEQNAVRCDRREVDTGGRLHLHGTVAHGKKAHPLHLIRAC